MKPKTLPARLKRTYESLPTLQKLHDAHPELKLYQLREMLRDVPCYRCPDGSVRYAAAEAAEAMAQPPPTAEERDDDQEHDDDEDDDPTQETPRVLGALQLFNEALRLNGHQAKMHAELMKVYESSMRAMVEPFKCGVTMLTDTVKELREQNKEHAERWDTLVTLMESAQSNQHQRELEMKREATRSEFRKELGVAVVAQLPMVLEMLAKKNAANDTKPKDGETPSSSGSSGPTEPPPGGSDSPPPAPAAPPAAASETPKPAEIAVLAFDALGSVPVAVFDVIAEELPEEQRAKFVRFKTALEALGSSAQQPAERAANDQSLNHASAPS